MHFYDVLDNREIDYYREKNKIMDLLNQQTYDKSIMININKNFHLMKHRGTATNLQGLIELIMLNIGCNESEIVEAHLMFEAILTSSKQCMRKNSYHLANIWKMVSDNINNILDLTGYETIEHNNCILIIEKNVEVSEAIKNVDCGKTALALLDYNRAVYKNDIQAKQSILVNLAHYIEPIRNNKIFKGTDYKQLLSDIGFYINKLNIRHNNTSDEYYIKLIENGTLEEWYDKAYNSMVMLICAEKQLQYSKELKQLKIDCE